MEQIVNRMIELADQGYFCSQILMVLALEQQGKENQDMVNASAGLGHGCGFFGGTCGILTGAAMWLSMFAAPDISRPEDRERLEAMLSDLGDWFEQHVGGQYGGIRCRDIAGDLIGTPDVKAICGTVIMETYGKALEILSEYGYNGVG